MTQETTNTEPKSPLIPPAQVSFTPPLVSCLLIISRMHGRPLSAASLEANLPRTAERLTPYACIRAAAREGLDARIVHRPDIQKISSLNLPCVLLMANDNACVLESLEDDQARIVTPENPEAPFVLPLEKLQTSYSGHAIFARSKDTLDSRTKELRIFDTKKWFWSTILHFLPIYRHVLLASVFINLLGIASSLFTLNVYDRVVPNNAQATLWVLAIGVFIAFLFDFLLKNLRGYFVDIAGKNADVLVGSKLMSHLLSIRLDNKPDSTGALANNIREFDSLRDFISSTTILALVDLPFLFFFIAIIALIGGSVALLPAIMAPIVILVGILIQGPLTRHVQSGYKESTHKNALLVETIGGLETIKTSRAEGPMLGRWERIIGQGAHSSIRAKSLATFSTSFTQLASQLVYCGIVIWGVYKIAEGEMTMGGLIACSILVGRTMAPLSAVAAMLTRVQQSRMALKNLDALMNIPSERSEDVLNIDHKELLAEIRVEDLSFQYPNAMTNALRHVTLRVAPGEHIGIIGKMGSGKTTLGKLLTGLYQPQKGAILLGGLDIRQIDPALLRSRIGYMAQDNFLFYGTVRENITLGAPHVSDQAILRAAAIAGVTDFVRNTPQGFNLPVGERGLALSGGQRQAVTIARALLLDPDIVIFDEPSSSMDMQVEAALRMRLAATLKEKTLILITHRPAMLSLVERIIVMQEGKIIADGPREKILKNLQGTQGGQTHG